MPRVAVLAGINGAGKTMQRIAARVRAGGHFVPDSIVRQRCSRSVKNFFDLYREHTELWEVYDNSHGQGHLIAMGNAYDESIGDEAAWAAFQRSAEND